MSQEQNPYKKLYIKLTEHVKHENPQTAFTMKKLLEIFMEVVETDPDMKFMALNFFSLMELCIVKIILKKDKFNRFIGYFTAKNFLRDSYYEMKGDKRIKKRRELDYFIRVLKSRYNKVTIKSRFIANQINKLSKIVILKLQRIRNFKLSSKDPDYYIRKLIREKNLAPYFQWTIRVGRKFSNRQEIDYSNYYVMQSIQEHQIKREKRRENKKVRQ